MAKNYTLGTPPFCIAKKQSKAEKKKKKQLGLIEEAKVAKSVEFDRAGAKAMIDERVSLMPQLAASLTGGMFEIQHAPPLKGRTVECQP